MYSFIVKPYKGRSQPINICGHSDIKSLIFFPLFDVDDLNSTLLCFFISILIHCHMHHTYPFNACQQVYLSVVMDV